VTDIPEHLLARSRERRAALGLGGDDVAATPAPAAGPTGSTPGAAVAATPAAAAVVVPEVVEPPKPPPPYVAAALARPKVPIFVAPILVALPIFAFIYWGSLAPKPAPDDPVFALGQSVYAAQCSSCHGAGGGGGTGRPLDEVVTVFPDAADHVAWVREGNTGLAAGTPYGVGRQAKQAPYDKVSMPGFAGTLSEEEIAAVVHYERVEFGGEAPAAEAGAGGESSSTTPE